MLLKKGQNRNKLFPRTLKKKKNLVKKIVNFPSNMLSGIVLLLFGNNRLQFEWNKNS